MIFSKKWCDIDDSSIITYNEMTWREKGRYKEKLEKHYEKNAHINRSLVFKILIR